MKGNFVLLRAGTLRLVVPQAQVGAASYLDERPVSGEYAAISDEMTLLDECPSARFIAAPFCVGDDSIQWCWDELRVLIDADLEPVRLPDCIVAGGTPVDAWVEIAGEPAFLCDAARLCRYALGSRD